MCVCFVCRESRRKTLKCVCVCFVCRERVEVRLLSVCVCFVCRESRSKTLSVCVFCLQRE